MKKLVKDFKVGDWFYSDTSEKNEGRGSAFCLIKQIGHFGEKKIVFACTVYGENYNETERYSTKELNTGETLFIPTPEEVDLYFLKK